MIPHASGSTWCRRGNSQRVGCAHQNKLDSVTRSESDNVRRERKIGRTFDESFLESGGPNGLRLSLDGLPAFAGRHDGLCYLCLGGTWLDGELVGHCRVDRQRWVWASRTSTSGRGRSRECRGGHWMEGESMVRIYKRDLASLVYAQP